MTIDQSGRIEETNHHTIISLADKNRSYTLKLPSSVKKDLLKIFRKLGKPKSFPIIIFSVSVFLSLLKSKYKFEILVIDIEYPGHENTIKNIIYTYCRKFKINKPKIYFSNIGKNDQAHINAINTFRNRIKPDCILHLEDFKGFFRMRKKRK